MKMFFLALLVGLSPSLSAVASENNHFTAVMGYGLDARAERDQGQNTLTRSWHSLMFGAGLDNWLGIFEYSTFTEASGNSTLSVSRKSETALIWAQFHAKDMGLFDPYIGIGFGGYRDSTESTLYEQVRQDQSAWTEHVGAALGVRWSAISPIWVSIEGRIHSNKYLDPSPMLSALLRIGFVLEN